MLLSANANRYKGSPLFRLLDNLHLQDGKFRDVKILRRADGIVPRIEEPIAGSWFSHFSCDNELDLSYHGICLLYTPFFCACQDLLS